MANDLCAVPEVMADVLKAMECVEVLFGDLKARIFLATDHERGIVFDRVLTRSSSPRSDCPNSLGVRARPGCCKVPDALRHRSQGFCGSLIFLYFRTRKATRMSNWSGCSNAFRKDHPVLGLVGIGGIAQGRGSIKG